MTEKEITDPVELDRIHSYWQACNYLAAGMIYLRDNSLLRKPLEITHLKTRLLGHWGSSPGLSFIYIHLNKLIKDHNLQAMFIAGPGHGAPGVIAPVYLEGSYSEVYPLKSESEYGLTQLFKEFSFPGGIGSHCTPELPGSIHEGGELGYSLSHAFGAAFDNKDLLVAVVVGDGEAETGPLAAAWHSNKFLNPERDGAVLPILHLNGYKINNPTILSRIPPEELDALFCGYGWKPLYVEGSDPLDMHRAMVEALQQSYETIKNIQSAARSSTGATIARPQWPMIILRSPKGWTGPKKVDGHQIEGSWRSHQVPLKNVHSNAKQFQALEKWLKSYEPEKLFDDSGRLVEKLREMAPTGDLRMGSNRHCNGGLLRKALDMPDYRDYALKITSPGSVESETTVPLGNMLRDILIKNPSNFRVFGPDETTSNKLHPVYSASKKTWMSTRLPVDDDEGYLARDGRIMELLSEHTLEGWLEGYLLTGRHGFFATYEAFVHVIDSMINQHAKWLSHSLNISWRAPVSSLNLLITSTVWRQDHNGFTHQDPGILNLVVNKDPTVTRIYLPPDANTLLSVSDHCLKSQDYINIIVADKQKHLQYLDEEAATKHCALGLGIWDWASSDEGEEPDVVIASCGDVPTKEALAAVQILRECFPELKIRFVNVVDLFKLSSPTDHPHGLNNPDFDSLFTLKKPVIFNFHGYPWLIHRLVYDRANHKRFHVRGYRETGDINTPLELAMNNGIDRFSLVIDVINSVPELSVKGAHIKQKMKENKLIHKEYAYEHGVDKPEITEWRWSG